jgi:hypothetical protein
MTSVVIFSVVLHVVWVVLVGLVSPYIIDYSDLMVLLAAQPGKLFQDAIARAGAYVPLIFLYFATLSISALAVGRFLRWAIMRYRLDRDWWFSDFVKFDTPWYYFFDSIETGFDGILVTATVDTGEGTALYTGVVIDYRFDKDGALERVVLSAASKQLLNQDDPEEVPIMGVLVLRYAEVKALSVAPVNIKNDGG